MQRNKSKRDKDLRDFAGRAPPTAFGKGRAMNARKASRTSGSTACRTESVWYPFRPGDDSRSGANKVRQHRGDRSRGGQRHALKPLRRVRPTRARFTSPDWREEVGITDAGERGPRLTFPAVSSHFRLLHLG